jgi:STE24 endopeptidase
MSEMTAARMVRLGLATLIVAWLVAAFLLWQTDVPPDVRIAERDVGSLVPDLERRERHDRFLRVVGLAALAAELGGLFVLARRRPAGRGPALARAAQLAALAILVAFLARLPFSLAILWWQRRYDVARVGYLQWLVDRLPGLAQRAAVLALAAVVVVALARRLGTRWWLAGAPAFVVIGVAVVLAQPLLTPRVDPLERPALVAEIRALAARQGLDDVEVELRRAASRTRQLNAEVLGIGPTTRVILWDTSLELPRPVLRFLVAHELAHVSRDHLWKGLAWFVLLALPLTYALAGLVPLSDPRAVPRAILVGTLLVLAITPLANAVSRRYEAEADWVALETTRDPGGAVQLFLAVSAAGVRDPDPPRWYVLAFGTHPPLVERIGMADFWSRTDENRRRVAAEGAAERRP